MPGPDIASGTPARSLLRGRYLVQDPLSRMALRTVDAILDCFPAVNGPSNSSSPLPRRVLLALGGHLGDAIIATAAISFAREQLPDAEIGVVAASWARSAFDGNRAITRVHVMDHWKVNRVAGTMGDRVRRHLATRREALREIREARYDLAIDLYPYFPNSAALLKAAGIPVRVGYTSAGLGALYTDPVPFVDEPVHQAEQQARLIARALGRPWSGGLRYRLAATSAAAQQHVAALLDGAGISRSGYVVAHMAAATPQLEWARQKLRATIEHLVTNGHEIVFTGLAGREAELAGDVVCGLPRCANLAGRLTWAELLAVVERAKLVVSVDTAVAHAASAYEVPTVTLMATIARPEHWRPLNARGTALSHPMPCAPCFVRAGCAHMSCVREIAVEDVIRAVESRLQ